ncbi:MAG: hypothetical protein ACI8ZM_003097 [Crocinitomix sp.]|jgi:hypothetical protein
MVEFLFFLSNLWCNIGFCISFGRRFLGETKTKLCLLTIAKNYAAIAQTLTVNHV